jgi:hypothetical protein
LFVSELGVEASFPRKATFSIWPDELQAGKSIALVKPSAPSKMLFVGYF